MHRYLQFSSLTLLRAWALWLVTVLLLLQGTLEPMSAESVAAQWRAAPDSHGLQVASSRTPLDLCRLTSVPVWRTTAGVIWCDRSGVLGPNAWRCVGSNYVLTIASLHALRLCACTRHECSGVFVI
jgi:hypothetical protein